MESGTGTGTDLRGRRFRAAMRAAWYAGLAGMAGSMHLAMYGAGSWPGAACTSAVAGAAIAAWLAHRRGRGRGPDADVERLRRCGLLSRRVDALLASLPCRTEAGTLAVLHEVRNCYAEALEQAGRLGGSGGGGTGDRLAARLRRNMAQIDGLYDVQTGSLRCTAANAAEFAAAMRTLGRDVDGSMRP